MIPNSLLTTCPGALITSWGAMIPIGNLQFHQRRDFIFDVDVSEWYNGNNFLEATLEFQQFSLSASNLNERITISCENQIAPATDIELLTLEANLFRSELIERTIVVLTNDNEQEQSSFVSNTRKKFENMSPFSKSKSKSANRTQKRVVGRRDSVSEDLSVRMKLWVSEIESKLSNTSQQQEQEQNMNKLKDYIEALFLDLTKEINLACENSSNFEKWGKHYLPSIRRAHQLQQCNNFKDPGVQFYGGPLFNSLRDEAEDVFCTLPAPTPSSNYNYNSNSYSYYNSTPTSNSTSSSNTNSYDMSAYMNASAGCISGGCEVLLSDGSLKLMESIVKGDKVSCNLSFNNPHNMKYEATVECVVRTRCTNQIEMVRFPSGLIATPWHPVYLMNQNNNNDNNDNDNDSNNNNTKSKEWVFPIEFIGESQLSSEEWIYNLVLGPIKLIQDQQNIDNNNKINELNRGQSFVVNGVECISLAHGITNDKVAEHEFYGSEKVVESLQSLVGIDSYFKNGIVTMNSSQVIRDPITGLVCNYSSSSISQE